MKPLPPFLVEMLDAPPHAGEGVHNWLFRVARQLHAHLPAVGIIALLEERTRDCGRNVSRKEIEDAVRTSISSAWKPRGKTTSATHAEKPAPKKWPDVNKERREAVIAENGGLPDLWECGNPRPGASGHAGQPQRSGDSAQRNRPIGRSGSPPP